MTLDKKNCEWFNIYCSFAASYINGRWWRMTTMETDMEVYYRKTYNISRTLVGNEIVDNSDVVGASPVGAAPTTSSFST